jgi:hypothetical protein
MIPRVLVSHVELLRKSLNDDFPRYLDGGSDPDDGRVEVVVVKMDALFDDGFIGIEKLLEKGVDVISFEFFVDSLETLAFVLEFGAQGLKLNLSLHIT